MNNLNKNVFTLICLLLLQACGNPTKTAAFIPEPSSDKAVVYIYRPAIMANVMYSPALYINDEFKLDIRSGRVEKLLLQPGKYSFQLAPEKNYTGTTRITTELETGTYYLRVDSTINLKQQSNYQPYERTFDLAKVNPIVAIQQISECCSIKTEQKTDTTTAKDKVEQDSSFSVNKTQNPFSH